MAKPKKPKHTAAPSNEKVPRGGSVAQTVRTFKFRWNTESCDYEGPYGWSEIEMVELLGEVIPKLQNFESQTWDEIETKSNNRHHFIKVDQLSTNAKARLPMTQLDGLEDLFSLRLEGSIRVWGGRAGPVFQVLWYDPEHQVYPVVAGSDKQKEAKKKQRNQQSTSK